MLSDRNSPKPLAVRVENDGAGSASFDWQPTLDALTRGLEPILRDAVGRDVVILGVRFTDADGRAVSGPVPTGFTLVGFTRNPTNQGDQPCAASPNE